MVTLIILVLILGLLIFIHELGHFISAKKCGVHIYEFALGMGPRIWSKKGKDGVIYAVRAFPIGGFVQMAGEVLEDDKKVKKDEFLCNKPAWQKLVVMLAGVTMNFILALVVLFASALIWGYGSIDPVISMVTENSAAQKAGIKEGDLILKIDDYNIGNWDKASLVLLLEHEEEVYNFKIQREDGTIENVEVTPEITKDKDGKETKTFGIGNKQVFKSFGGSIKYAFQKFGTIIEQMCLVIGNLFTGKLSLGNLSGPVGMYSIVDQSKAYGIRQILYLVALLSINLGFINAIPFPAFDGGRALFIVIGKIKGSPVDSKIENTIHTIGFALLMLLMLYITFQDVLKLF